MIGAAELLEVGLSAFDRLTSSERGISSLILDVAGLLMEVGRLDEAEKLYVEALATRRWVRLVPSRVHLYDAVRSAEAWVAPADYATAEPNPLARAAAGLLPLLMLHLHNVT